MQSVTAHFDEIEHFINSENPLILCLTETHLTENIDDREVIIENYNLVRLDSLSRATGGVLLYIKNHLKFVVDKTYVMQMNYWCIFIKVIIESKYNCIGVLYHSPSSSDLVFLEFVENLCDEYLIKQKCPVILAGDFNINFLNDSTYSNRLKSCLNNYGLKQHIDKPTNISYLGQQTLIDLIISNERHINYTIMSPLIGNHSLIKIELKSNIKKNVHKLHVENQYKILMSLKVYS